MAEKSFDEAARKSALADEYEKGVQQRIADMRSHLSNAAWDFIDWRKLGRRYSVAVKSAFEKALQDGALPSAYIREHMQWFLQYVLPAEEHAAFFSYVDGIRDYPYSASYCRRSYRARSYAPYADQLADIMEKCARDRCRGLSVAAYLTRTLPEGAQVYADSTAWNCGYSEHSLTMLLDAHDAATEEAVRTVLTSEVGGAVTHELVRGVLRSHSPAYYELVCKLLVAARLQEGVRQVICESADCGTRAGFMELLRTIEENNLIRFSAVKRAVGTWLGLASDEVRDLDRVSDKSVRLIMDYLAHPAAREAALGGTDAMEIYIALWCHAYEGLESAEGRIEQLIQEGTHHQVLTAGYFATHLDERKTAHRLGLRACLAHPDEKDTLAVWLASVLPFRSILLRHTADGPAAVLTDYFRDREETYALIRLLENIMTDCKRRALTFSPCVFPWFEAKITKNEVADIFCTTAALVGTPELIDKACPMLSDCSPNGRYAFVMPLLSPPRSAIQRRTVLDALADKESFTRRDALKVVSGMHLTADEYAYLASFLRFKAEDVRSAVLSLLRKQEDAALSACIARLLQDAKEEVRLGGLDLLVQLKADEARRHTVADFLPQLTERMRAENLPSKEKLLLETLLPKQEAAVPTLDSLYAPDDVYLPNLETGQHLPEGFAKGAAKCAAVFARYFPDSDMDILTGKKKHAVLGAVKGLFGGAGDGKPCPSAKVADDDLTALSQYITEHLTDMATPPGENAKPLMLGEMTYQFRYDPDGSDGQVIPAQELWAAWAAQRGMTCGRIVRAMLRYKAWPHKTSLETEASPLLAALFGAGFDAPLPSLPQMPKVHTVLEYMLAHVPAMDKEELGAALGLWFMKCVPDHMVMVGESKHKVHLLTHDQLYFLFSRITMTCCVKECFAMTFPLSVAVAERCMDAYRKTPPADLAGSDRAQYYTVYRRHESRQLHYDRSNQFYDYKLVDVEAYLRALQAGIIREEQFFEFVLRPDILGHGLSLLTSLCAIYCDGDRSIAHHGLSGMQAGFRRRDAVRQLFGTEEAVGEDANALLRLSHKLCGKLLPTILEPEYKRGDSPAAYSKYVLSVHRVTGADQLVRILEAFGNDTLNRTGYFYSTQDRVPGRNITLTHLLSVCLPAASDTADTLRHALSGKKITQKRLIEAALYAPEWIPVIGEYLGIPGFESVCYYFIAHMNEKFDDKRRAVIARYTPLCEEELNLGAFDRAWFEAAYASVGDKLFEQIYTAAKYISDGAKHARARKYADACLGRYTVDELEATIADKRNKDLLMAYALIPAAGEDDICRRYLYIGKFRKESKTFGSQRAVSEGKAADMALTNLAQTAGYRDTMRLTLRMETKLMEDSRALLCPHTVDDVVIEPVIGEDGTCTLTVTKDGKPLKSVPARLKKHETVLTLTALTATLNEQYRRTRLMLEQAMEDETAFSMQEITSLFAHPVVKPMIGKLVFVSGDVCGFPTVTGLVSADGTQHPLPADATLTVAHPYTLLRLGVWRAYQAYLYEHKTVQAFRQVFRELYVKTADERGTDHSLRYAGHQVQPAKTLAVLKTRRWVADVEDGLQKVYYKENIVARIYAMADWFSPADIEAPTLEWVEFTDRHTGKTLPIDDIPDILFSEVMRDVDLAVSVAHVGGVDPEASHSTVEMREAILSFVLPMFRLSNVKVENGRAVIDGKLANYTVHLGSGVVHQIGGTMIPVLPVHSAHRGQVFLPFVDEDPKTAEIISKVILFAADDKIRDPMILSAIQR